MRAFYVLAVGALVLGALASALVLRAPRRAAPSAPPSAISTLESAVTAVSDPGSAEANRPEPGANVTDTSTGAGAGRTAPNPRPITPEPKDGRAKSPSATPATGGMIVVRDPESGALVAPTPQQVRALMGASSEATSHSDAGLVERAGPGGAVILDLNGRFQEYATLSVGRDGKRHFGCVPGEAHAHPDSIPMPAAPEEQ